MTTKELEKLSFESAAERLDEIITQLENSKIELDTAIKLYSEAKDLQKHCEKRLSEAQLKVEQITQNDENEIINKNN